MVLGIYNLSDREEKDEEKDDDLWDRWNWKKVVRTVFISLGAAIFVVCASLVMLVKNSSSFRQGVLAHAGHSLYASTGARISARDFHLDFFPPRLDLYGVIVHGSEPEFSQPLLFADHVAAELKWSSLRYRRWNLRSVVVDHAVVRYSVSASGESNLPQPETRLRSTAHVADVAIEQVQIRGGEIYWNDNKAPFEAELNHARFTAEYDGAARHYRSTVRYGQGTVRAGNYALLDHALETNFELTPAKLTINHLALTAGKFRLALSGSIEDYNHPALQATYDAQLEAADLEPYVKTTLPVTGALHLAGSLNYRAAPGHPALETVSVNGTVSSPSLKLTLGDPHADAAGDFHVDAVDAGAKYKLSAGNAEFENIHAQVLGGNLTGSLTIHDVGGAAYSVLEAHLKNASLERLQKAAGRTATPEAALSGAVQADAAASWYIGFKDLVAHGNLSLQGTLGAASATPLRAAIHAEYEAAGHKLSFHQTFLKTAQTMLNLEGTTGSFGDEASLRLSLNSGNLHEVELLAGNFPATSTWGPWPGISPWSTEQGSAQRSPASASLRGNLDLYGAATFTAFISNSGGIAELKGQLEARNLRVKGTSWKLVRTDINITPSSLTFSNGSLEAAFPERTTANESPRPTRVRISSLPFQRIGEPQASLHGAIGGDSK